MESSYQIQTEILTFCHLLKQLNHDQLSFRIFWYLNLYFQSLKFTKNTFFHLKIYKKHVFAIVPTFCPTHIGFQVQASIRVVHRF